MSTLLLFFPLTVHAQSSDPKPDGITDAGPFPLETIGPGDTELGGLVAAGFAHNIGGGVGHRQFLTFGGRLGRILAEPSGPGFLRGDFEIALEVLPVFLIFQETTLYGFSTTLLFRHHFSPGRQIRPFLSVGAGTLISTGPVPPQASSFNFTPQGGLGIEWFREPGLAYLFEYRFLHISDGGLSEPNPGVNTSSFFFGVSVFR